MKIIIRKGKPEDTEAIADLWIAMMREHRGFEPRLVLSAKAREHYADYANYHAGSEDSIVLVAESFWEEDGALGLTAGRVIGFALSYRVRNYPMFEPAYYGFVSDVTVAKALRGQKIGERLMRRTEELFHERGVRHIHLHVYHANEDGRRFWKQLGYENYIEGLAKRI